MKKFRRLYKKENYPVPVIRPGDHIKFRHSGGTFEGELLYFNLARTKFRVRILTGNELWVNVKPHNEKIKAQFQDGRK